MYVEPVPILPPRRGRRLATTLTALGPVAALVVVVALARSAGPNAPMLATPPADGRLAASPSAGVVVEGEAGQAAIPNHAFGLPVRTVEETLAALRTGQLSDGLVAVFGHLTADRRGSDCGDLPADGLAEAFCRRSVILSGPPADPIAGSEPDPGPSATPPRWRGPHLHGQVLAGTALPASATSGAGAGRPSDAIPVILIGRFDDPRAAPCGPGGRHCGEEFVVERLAWAAGRWHERVFALDPALPDPAIAGGGRLARIIASREADRGEAILAGAILLIDLLRVVDPVAADAADAVQPDVGGPVWYLRSVASARVGAGQRLLSWVVIDDRTGLILATGPPSTD